MKNVRRDAGKVRINSENTWEWERLKMTKKYNRKFGSKRSQGIPTPRAPQNGGNGKATDAEAIKKFKDYINSSVAKEGFHEDKYMNVPVPVKKKKWWQKLLGGGR